MSPIAALWHSMDVEKSILEFNFPKWTVVNGNFGADAG